MTHGTRIFSQSTARSFRAVDLSGSCGPVVGGGEVIFWWGEKTVQLWPDDVSNPFHRGPTGSDIADVGRRMIEPLEFYCAYCDEKRDRANCPACGHHTHLMREIK